MKKSANLLEYPLGMVGGTNFGRYPTISVEQTFNMIESQGFLVPYAGYKLVDVVDDNGKGRGIFNSERFGRLIFVIDDGVYIADKFLSIARVGTLKTNEGDVFIDENDARQIAICDRQYIYIYDYGAGTFNKIDTDFVPAYVAFQDGYFIAPVKGEPKWRLSAPNNGTSWPAAPANVGAFQTKPDNCVAGVRFPGKGSLLFIFGKTVVEPWFDSPNANFAFPYKRSETVNIDYGCLNAATIACGDEFVIWLGGNEKSGPVILLSEGGVPKQISNEGLNFKFAQLKKPEESYGFLFKQDGHLLYQLTFSAKEDNFSIVYDLTTNKFFTLTDPNMNIHIAKRVAFYNNSYYFVSFIDGNLYELSTKYVTADGNEIPYIRVTPTFRMKDTTPFVHKNTTFLLEQGNTDAVRRVDVSVSNDGGVSFSSFLGLDLNRAAIRRNKIDFWNFGYANELCHQFRFWGKSRFVVGEGVASVYQ